MNCFECFCKKSGRILSIALVLATIVFFGGTAKPVWADELTAYEQKAVKLLNKDRTVRGLRPLEVDMRLVYVGREHAADMIKRGYFSHVTPEGGTPFDRLKKVGVRYMLAGENIAMHYSVDGAQKAWMQSRGHRENILNQGFTHVGIGVIEHKDGSLYLVQVFIGV